MSHLEHIDKKNSDLKLTELLEKTVQELQETSAKENKEERKRKKTTEILDIITKAMQAVTFLSVIYGSWMLFSFSKENDIKYTDLVGSSFIISFGVFSAVAILVIALFPSLIVILSHINSKSNYKNLVHNSRFHIAKNNKLKTLLAYNLIISLWPFIHILSKERHALTFTLLYPPVMHLILLALSNKKVGNIIYALSFTLHYPPAMNLILSELSNKKSKNIIKTSLLQMVMLIIEVILSLITIIFLSSYIKSIYSGVNDWALSLIFSVAFFTLKYPRPSTNNKKAKSTTASIVFLLSVEAFFIFSFPFSSQIGNTIAKSIDLNLGERCFIANKDLTDKIPGEYIKNVLLDDKLAKLNITTNVGDVYYLIKNNEETPSIRIEGLHLTMKNCPSEKNQERHNN
ncbi:hypothetical protein [Serratia rubidaea]|uniref:hypothetical protein n=1 Tax=Serratia rubidaea TaxID=61652 RepID=UPI001BAFA26B|nr:hypothetical protein [Serratia rubidaea]MBS0973046.1 hypothetical protein [Serratia rubidaea]MDC6109353.1 hypothetical protein [Serratia rubidaea]